jgi:hypothetical protein
VFSYAVAIVLGRKPSSNLRRIHSGRALATALAPARTSGPKRNTPADHLFTLFVRQAARCLDKKLLIALRPRPAIML